MLYFYIMGIKSRVQIKLKNNKNKNGSPEITLAIGEEKITKPRNPFLKAVTDNFINDIDKTPSLTSLQKQGKRIFQGLEKMYLENNSAEQFDGYEDSWKTREILEQINPELKSAIKLLYNYNKKPVGMQISLQKTSYKDNQESPEKGWVSLKIFIGEDFPERLENSFYFSKNNISKESGIELLRGLDSLFRLSKNPNSWNQFKDTVKSLEEYRNSLNALDVDDLLEEDHLYNNLLEFGNADEKNTFLKLTFDQDSNYNVYSMGNFFEYEGEMDDYYEEQEQSLNREIKLYQDAWNEHGREFRFTKEQCEHILANQKYKLITVDFKNKWDKQKFESEWPNLKTQDLIYEPELYEADDWRRLMGALILRTFKRDIPGKVLNNYTTFPNFEKHVQVEMK